VTLADLSRIIRKAPEAKRCLMKRLFEYLIAEDQTIDGGYLDELTRKFEAEAAQNSSTAMKNAIVRIVLSNTYRQVNADPRACYDHAAAAKLDNAPPCRVAFILQKNCAQCHAGPDGNASLDLTSWIVSADGKTRTFPHLDHDRKQIAVHETLTRIADRLSSTDPAVRMPRLMVMPGQERQELFLWVQEELARLAKSVRR
jgi:Tfp pilus assembly protein PilV